MKHIKSIFGLFAIALALVSSVAFTRAKVAKEGAAHPAALVWIKYNCASEGAVYFPSSGTNYALVEESLPNYIECGENQSICAQAFNDTDVQLAPDGRNLEPKEDAIAQQTILCD